MENNENNKSITEILNSSTTSSDINSMLLEYKKEVGFKSPAFFRAIYPFCGDFTRGEVTEEAFVSVLGTYYKVLNEKVGTDDWDFDVRQLDGNVLDIYVEIFYDKIVIKNSEDINHTIKELIVRIPLIPNPNIENDLIPSEIKGYRTFISHIEKVVGYKHSHLNPFYNAPVENASFPSVFCLGAETPLAANISNFHLSSEKITEDDILCFLYNIDSLVEWESIEGVPYIHIRKLVNSNTMTPATSDTNVLESAYNFLIEKWDLETFKKGIRTYYHLEQIKVDKSSLEKAIFEAIGDSYNEMDSNIFSTLHNRRVLLPVLKDEETASNYESGYMVVSDKEFVIGKHILNLKVEDPIPDLYYKDLKINKNLINYITNEIEKQIFERTTKDKIEA